MDWKTLTPEEMIQAFKKKYPKISTCSYKLSLYKHELKQQECPEQYLKQLRLTKDDYTLIRRGANAARAKDAACVRTITNADDIYGQACCLLLSDDPDKNLAALFPLTGLRPVEILRAATYCECDPTKTNYPKFAARQLTFAKRKSKENEARDRVFLAPTTLILKALANVRMKYYPIIVNYTNNDIDKHIKMKPILRKYLTTTDMNPRMLRRFFANLAFVHFSDFVPGQQASLISFCSHHLCHQILADEVICYSSMRLDPPPRMSPLVIFQPYFKSLL